MSARSQIALVVTSLAFAVVGCDRKPAKPSAPAPTGPVRTGTASIRGTVTLAGKPPEMATLPNQYCHPGAGPLKEESVVVDGQGHLQNVIVYLENAPAAARASNLPPVVLDQANCRYVPHVVALRTGQALHVTTSDPTLHNVHGLCTVNEAFNFALVAPGQSKDLVFNEPERFPIRCDVHPWMRAYVQVFAHPWFAVTAADGSFEIRDVPAGSYTLVAWQEKYGEQRIAVTIPDGQTVSAPITFQSGL